MAFTKAQDALLRKLENGSEITFKGEHYVIISEGKDEKIWPSTFYGLFDDGMVEKLANGNYTVSANGIRKIRSKDE
jgi:hypothetical protein